MRTLPMIKAFRTAIITTEDGTQWSTSITCSNETIRKYFMGKYVDVGTYPTEKMSKVTNLVII